MIPSSEHLFRASNEATAKELTDASVPVPDYHQPGMRVPKGGSMCANCMFADPANPAGPTCNNPYFIDWDGGPTKPVGSGLLPAPPDEYCSDWWEPTVPDVGPLDAKG